MEQMIMSWGLFSGSIALLAYVAYQLRLSAKERKSDAWQREEFVLIETAIEENQFQERNSTISLDLSQYQQRTDIIEDDLSVYAQIAIFNATAGNIYVQAGGVLLLYGICAGNIVINPKASVAIYGTVVGSITNNGGNLQVYGKVIGEIKQNSGETAVFPVAQVMRHH